MQLQWQKPTTKNQTEATQKPKRTGKPANCIQMKQFALEAACLPGEINFQLRIAYFCTHLYRCADLPLYIRIYICGVCL